jgi:hypothetical protein
VHNVPDRVICGKVSKELKCRSSQYRRILTGEWRLDFSRTNPIHLLDFRRERVCICVFKIEEKLTKQPAARETREYTPRGKLSLAGGRKNVSLAAGAGKW